MSVSVVVISMKVKREINKAKVGDNKQTNEIT